jgi:hypothetical protein
MVPMLYLLAGAGAGKAACSWERAWSSDAEQWHNNAAAIGTP